MKLITIFTDNDFWVVYKGKNLYQIEEKLYIVVQKEQDFIDMLYDGIIDSNEIELIREMASQGEGDYGNYAYWVEKYTPFVHNLARENDESL